MPEPPPVRTVSRSRKVPTMRPQISSRLAPSRTRSATPTLAGRMSPAESLSSSRARTPKRKAGGAPTTMAPGVEQIGTEETNINVVVRCRGRNDREVRENSGVVVETDGIKGKTVGLSMGPSPLSNKTYEFDKVFNLGADQAMIFDDVVAPVLDEVLDGFNCTIFAYGQTGTGKTYTMSGDITDITPLPDDAGIIPRVLHSLFLKLGGDEEGDKREYSVKCSFIELYNEELRDLLAPDDNTKLKIFDEANKHGRTTTLVQGMEETHIKNASKGIHLLRQGSHRRQVAATKCNDLSSRSHTVFTITVYMKRTSDNGEDYLSSGKLNLVDLAGSENIQRSGAENKRATEAGLINKSLLTLGRVINALVEKSSHIPYRESKLTRLLQDSLGGRTKTCIIATLSPAKSNLEETISTLDYAFRAKNIRNKPQINQMVSKKTLLREFTTEIEKLKSELIATRQRNGVYLTAEAYEDLTTESESRRILSEEQRDKIEGMEARLTNKAQELLALTSNFQSLKHDNDSIRGKLDNTKGVLAKVELILEHTKQTLAEEAHLRKAHENTEEKLVEVGGGLLNTIETTTDHVNRLHSKLKRRSDLQSLNRTKWVESQSQVTDVTGTVEGRMEHLRSQQEILIEQLSKRMQSFVSDEMDELQSSQSFLHQQVAAFESSKSEVNAQAEQAKEELNDVLHGIGALRDDVKQQVGSGLNDLSVAAQRISAGISTELNTFHQNLQDSYVSLGREFKTLFEDLHRRMSEQQAEAQRLRQQISTANAAFIEAGNASQNQMAHAFEKEKETATKEREALMTQISALINNSATTQESRMSGYLESANKRIKISEDEFRVAQEVYGNGMDSWNTQSLDMIDTSARSRDFIKAKLQSDWTDANASTLAITGTTNAVYGETVRIVDAQMSQMDKQLVALDEIVHQIGVQANENHQAHTQSLGQLAHTVNESYNSISDHFEKSYSRTQGLERDMQERTENFMNTIPELGADGDIRQQLQDLREEISTSTIAEYSITGETPNKMEYLYPAMLPRTERHEILLDRLRGVPTRPPSPIRRSPSKSKSSPSKYSSQLLSPTKTLIFNDKEFVTTTPFLPPPIMRQPSDYPPASAPNSRPQSASTHGSLRELDVNVAVVPQPGLTVHSDSDLDPNRADCAALGKAEDLVDCGTVEGLVGKMSAPTPSLRRCNTNPLSASLSSVPQVITANPLASAKLPPKRGGVTARMTVASGIPAALANEKENVALLSASVGSYSGRRLRSRGSD